MKMYQHQKLIELSISTSENQHLGTRQKTGQRNIEHFLTPINWKKNPKWMVYIKADQAPQQRIKLPMRFLWYQRIHMKSCVQIKVFIPPHCQSTQKMSGIITCNFISNARNVSYWFKDSNPADNYVLQDSLISLFSPLCPFF